MKIFHDLDLVEEIGSGMERILAVYTPNNFELTAILFELHSNLKISHQMMR